MAKIAKKKTNNSIKKPHFAGFLDVIATQGMNFESRSFEMGDLHYRILTITQFPPKVRNAWLARVTGLPGVITSIHSKPSDPLELVKQINISMGELASKLDSGGNPVSLKRAQNKYDAAELLLKKIDTEQQKVVYLTVVLSISAKDRDELNLRTRRVESALASSGFRGRASLFRQEDGLKTLGPWAFIHPEIEKIGSRNMPSETVAAAYPFVFSGLNDGSGVLLGTDKTGGIVLCDFWKREGSRTNSNMTVLGRPGVGKSTLVKKILLHQFAHGTKIIILDPEREYKNLCENLGGDWINCGGGSAGRINPLQVRNVPMDDDDEESPMYSKKNFSETEFGPLALHFQTLRTFFRLYLKDVAKRQIALLERALIQVYADKEIYWHTDPTTIHNEDWPTIIDLHNHIGKLIDSDQELSRDWQELHILLESAAKGADSAIWSGHTTIDAKSDFIVLDINNLLEADEEIRRAQFFNVLGWAWNEVAKDRNQPVILATDETYLLIDPEIPQALQFLRNTSKRIRKYEGGLMVITHNLVDFLDPAVRRYGQALIDNPVYKMIMGQGDKDIEALEKLMTLSEKEKQTLADGKRGEALFVAGNRRLHLKIDVGQHEMEMFGAGGGR
jgi:GTPase SAR1 family protein